MNKLDLSNFGGHPFTSDDLEFLQDNVIDAIKGVMSVLAGYTIDDVCVLSGCVITDMGLSYDYTSGYIWYQGEIYYVPTQSGISKLGPGQFALNINVTNISAGTVSYQNGSTVNTWKQRIAFINWDTSFTYPFINQGFYYPKFITSIIDTTNTFYKPNINATAWANLTLLNGWVQSVTYTPQWRIDELGNLRLRGQISGASSTNNNAFLLPGGLHADDIILPIWAYIAGATHKITLFASGGVTVGPPAGTDVYNLNNINIAL